jgi:hypothetical protein
MCPFPSFVKKDFIEFTDLKFVWEDVTLEAESMLFRERMETGEEELMINHGHGLEVVTLVLSY